ncbi:M3 family metallopeptidase [Porphyromonas sp. COT-290 OH3588]|uniref:M3 family metallopeptidase n=1 Tax=Porphyromonas sp. COT-290 OH3588 TaxID=1515617 RepID=UPI001F189E13|nr:M3 family metallopeptidase [Porphyromonas sp. COT-290 OH3588]
MKKLIITLSLAAMLAACQGEKKSNSSLEGNPLLIENTLEFGAPAFDQIRPEHFMPAFVEGMRQHLAEIDSIVNNLEVPTFENTLVPLQRAGLLLERTSTVFSGLAGANATDEIRKIEEEVTPLITKHLDAIVLNDRLFQRVKTVYEQQMHKLEGEDARLLEITYNDFVKQGANLTAEGKEQLKKVNEELSILTTKFNNLVKDGTQAAGILVDTEAELDGLSPASIAQAKQDAEQAGHTGKYLLNIQNTTRSAYLPELNNRDLRRRLLEASMMRGERGDANDTRQIVLDITRLRAEKARILGFDNYASWGLKDQMASKPEHVYSFIHKLVEAYAPKAQADAADLEAFARKTEGPDFKLEAWDWDYYAEKLRKQRYDLDENDIKPYFALDSVVKNGLFFVAKQLYGVDFVERHDLPVYADHVKVYDLLDEKGDKIAIFYTDYYRRPTKSGGAWMSNWVEQSHLLGRKPVVYNVCNYAPPVGGEPTLLNMDEVTTLFHEFGHGLHGLFADQKYTKLSGTSVARDFVEMPSQFHEHWATHPEVLRNYAKHYKTGEPIPAELVERMNAAAKFNQAYALGENIAAVVIDMAWHMRDGQSEVSDVAKFESEALKNMGMLNAQIPPRYRSTYFRHSMGGGYSAGYYAYLWAEVLDNNTYDWFLENGGFTRENGQRLRDLILSRGNSKDLNVIFQDMTGLSEPKIESLMKARGLK